MHRERSISVRAGVRHRRGAPAMVALAAACALGGCYSKVVKAEGFGASRVTTEEPDRKPGPVDKMLFGEDKTSAKKKTVK